MERIILLSYNNILTSITPSHGIMKIIFNKKLTGKPLLGRWFFRWVVKRWVPTKNSRFYSWNQNSLNCIYCVLSYICCMCHVDDWMWHRTMCYMTSVFGTKDVHWTTRVTEFVSTHSLKSSKMEPPNTLSSNWHYIQYVVLWPSCFQITSPPTMTHKQTHLKLTLNRPSFFLVTVSSTALLPQHS